MLALFTSVVVALAGFAVAQNSSSSIDPNSVSLTMKSKMTRFLDCLKRPVRGER